MYKFKRKTACRITSFLGTHLVHVHILETVPLDMLVRSILIRTTTSTLATAPTHPNSTFLVSISPFVAIAVQQDIAVLVPLAPHAYPAQLFHASANHIFLIMH